MKTRCEQMGVCLGIDCPDCPPKPKVSLWRKRKMTDKPFHVISVPATEKIQLTSKEILDIVLESTKSDDIAEFIKVAKLVEQKSLEKNV
jgi:hypothetical protein